MPVGFGCRPPQPVIAVATPPALVAALAGAPVGGVDDVVLELVAAVDGATLVAAAVGAEALVLGAADVCGAEVAGAELLGAAVVLAAELCPPVFVAVSRGAVVWVAGAWCETAGVVAGAPVPLSGLCASR